MWTVFIRHTWDPAVGCCDLDNKPSVSIKGEEFLVYFWDSLASQEGLCLMEF
jgi:hypothetical protein